MTSIDGVLPPIENGRFTDDGRTDHIMSILHNTRILYEPKERYNYALFGCIRKKYGWFLSSQTNRYANCVSVFVLSKNSLTFIHKTIFPYLISLSFVNF